MRVSRVIVLGGLVCAAGKLFLIPMQNQRLADVLVGLSDLALCLLIVAAAWQASRRSLLWARAFWLCVGSVAMIWAVHFALDLVLLKASVLGALSKAPGPALFIGSFPFALALALPLMLNEDSEKLKISWPQAMDIAQFSLVAFAAFLVFFYIPFLQVPGEIGRNRYIIGLHLTRDGLLALGYLYRAFRSRLPGLRGLNFRVSAFLILYAFSPLVRSQAVKGWSPLAALLLDVPALFLLATAGWWREEKSTSRPARAPESQTKTLWTQILAPAMPISVVVLASRIPAPYLRVAWMMVTASFALYAARLFLMQGQQNQTVSSLRSMEERFSKAFRSSPAAVIITRLADGRLIDANDRALELAKLSRDQAIGKTTLELGIFAKPEDRAQLMKALRERGSIQSMNFTFQLAGRAVNTLVSAEMIELEGEPLMIATVLDVSELKAVTEQLQQAQKMEVVGSLAGGVAHDFNNLLTIITGNAALALALKPTPELAEHICQIKEASGKAASLTRQLLAFSRRQILQPRNISLNAVVASAESLLGRTIGPNIALVTSYAPDLGTVYADPVQMEQVVMNLAVNARDAMPQGGRLFFETRNLDLASPYPGTGFEIPAGHHVILSVTDTGTGIQPKDLDRIFEPFFTTKAVGAGTGLGLSTVYGIVKQSRGLIWAYSEVGKGASFHVCLPRVDSRPDSITPPETGGDNLHGRETVLVVDDDLRVCALAANILGQFGYQVITAHSAEEAEQRAGEFQDEIHLLVTDIAMPRTTGWQLAQEMKGKRPEIKILYMSGYPSLAPAPENGAAPHGGLLPKPFTPIELAQRARKALNGG